MGSNDETRQKKVANPATARANSCRRGAAFRRAGHGRRADRGDCAAARANKAMLYYYLEISGGCIARLENLFRQLAHGVYDPPAERLRRASGCAIRHCVISTFWRRIRTIRGWCSGNRWRRPRLRLDRQPIFPAVSPSDWCERSRREFAAGEFRRVDPHHTAFTMIAMTMFYFAAARDLERVAGRDLLAPQCAGGNENARFWIFWIMAYFARQEKRR